MPHRSQGSEGDPKLIFFPLRDCAEKNDFFVELSVRKYPKMVKKMILWHEHDCSWNKVESSNLLAVSIHIFRYYKE